jgi:hypothetical protein
LTSQKIVIVDDIGEGNRASQSQQHDAGNHQTTGNQAQSKATFAKPEATDQHGKYHR